MIEYRCPCGEALQAGDDQAGLDSYCPACGAAVTVPAPPREEKAGKTPWGLILAVVMGGGLLVCCGGLSLASPVIREAVARGQEQANLKRLAIAMHGFHDKNGGFPAQALSEARGKPLLSWRVQLLPFLGENDLYKRFRLDQPWDSDHNKLLVAEMPKVYLRPGDEASAGGLTRCQAVVGRGLLFDRTRPAEAGLRTLAQITDGVSNTVLFVVAKTPVVWTKPEDVDGDDGLPLWPKLDAWNGGMNVAMADGSVKLVPATTPEEHLRAALTARGGERIGLDP